MLLYFLLVCVLSPISASLTLFSKKFPDVNSALSSACLGALLSPVNCDQALATLSSSNYWGPLNGTILDSQICPPSCAASLASYHNSVAAACAKDPQPIAGFPANYFGDRLWAYQNRTCIKDSLSREYCMSKSHIALGFWNVILSASRFLE